MRLLPIVADHVWQSTLFAALAALLAWATRKSPARVRHAIWFAASIKFLIPFSLLVSIGVSVRPASPVPLPPRVVAAAIEDLSRPFAGPDTSWIRMEEGPPTGGHHDGRQSWRQALAGHAATGIGGLWLIGCVGVLFWRWRAWRTVARAARAATPVGLDTEAGIVRGIAEVLQLRARVRVVGSEVSIEPAVLGLFRSTLLWPTALVGRLSDSEIEAIAVHELQHVRRRDNLTAAMHMVVEAIFWFHPVVWWLGARLVHERERACDEAVIAYGSQPRLYAESLLRVCRVCLASPVQCVSGVSGSDLVRRVHAIMTAIPLTVPLSKRVLLGAALSAVLLCPVAVGIIHASPVIALPSFETMLSPASTWRPSSLAVDGPTLISAAEASRVVEGSVVQAPPTNSATSGLSHLAASALPAGLTQTALTPPAKPGDPVIGKGDTLRIRSSLSQWDVTVAADGTVTFPGLGAIKLEGLTQRQIEDLIERGLGDKGLLGPRDRIIVEVQARSTPPVPSRSAPPRSASVYVNGEVGTPGQVFLDGEREMTLLHAINAAGNYTTRAGRDVIILRPQKSATGAIAPVTPDNTTAQRFTYSRKTLMATMEDPPVQDGDSIWVSQAELFFINGEVRAGGQRVWEEKMTVGGAIALAGGMTEKASLRRSYIRRKNGKGTFDQIGNLTAETPVLPRDELVIRPKLF